LSELFARFAALFNLSYKFSSIRMMVCLGFVSITSDNVSMQR